MKHRHALWMSLISVLIFSLSWVALDRPSTNSDTINPTTSRVSSILAPDEHGGSTSTSRKIPDSEAVPLGSDASPCAESTDAHEQPEPGGAHGICSEPSSAESRSSSDSARRLAAMNLKNRLSEMRRLMRERGAAGIRDLLTTWLGTNGKPTFGTPTSLQFGVGLAEYRLENKDAALDALLAALLGLPIPLEGIHVETKFDGVRWTRLITLNSDAVLFPGSPPDPRPEDWAHAWKTVVRLLPGQHRREFIAWLIDRAETDEHAVRAAAATIWAHAIVYGGPQNYHLGITPSERRVADAALTEAVQWDELTIETWYEVQDRVRALAGPGGHVDAQSQQSAWTTAMEAGEPARSRLIPWSLERDVQRILDGNASPEAERLRRLTAWLVERP